MKVCDYFFHYSNRTSSGSFDIRNVVRWVRTGEAYYTFYILFFNDGSNVSIDVEDFYRFEKKFNQLEIPATL